ncbi:hypothetical protein BDK92_7197 [Micromonospora pisi]|uniref:Uncharacterized protein n=1 Tax=Micromonospora pisi TaxID=589240 RepID=A0A495JX12_9ACTN|nr:hypothetical protein [Micromonospora pisi]RKR92719.1 hypothetical protein BDK92_7197 [Micromonospora pisi]
MTVQSTNVLARVADVIEPHIDGTFKVRDRAEGMARQLYVCGLLAGGEPGRSSLPVQEQAANVLQCVQSWTTAEQIAAELAEAGLLRQEN